MDSPFAGSRAFRYFITLVCLSMLLLAGSAWAGTGGKRSAESLKKNWAMQFEVNQDFDLSSFEGGTLSIMKKTSPGKSWRLGIDLDASTNNTDNLSIYNNTSTNTSESNNDRYSFAVSIHRVFDTDPSARLKLFYGFGPFGGYSYSKSTNRSTSGSNWTVGFNKAKTWSVGVGGIMGVEWFFSENMSLLAEYGSSLGYRWNKSTRTTNYSTGTNRADEGTSKTWDFDAEAVKFGLSAYF